MKKLFIALFMSLSVMTVAQSNTDTITTFFDGVINFQNVKVNDYNPIATVGNLASKQAVEILTLNGNNVSETFNKAKKYKHALILVGIHTAVLVTSWEDCAQSGAWGVCMPMGAGFIKRETLTKENGYINNLIGIPDTQRRQVFLFN